MQGHAWSARYYDGRTAASQFVEVGVSADGLYLASEDGSIVVWPYGELRVTAHGFPERPHRIERGNDVVEVLVVGDPEFWRAVRAMGGATSRHLRWSVRRGRTRVIVGVAAAAAAGIAALYVWGIPALANHVAATVPIEWEERLGARVVEGMLDAEDLCQDPVTVGAVERIVDRLAATAGSPYTFRVQVANGDVINAFAAPGGHIVVYQGLIAVTERAEELSGVLAHEMAHVIQRHGTRGALRQIPLQLLIGAATGDLGGTVQVLGALGVMHYGRRDEIDADREGLALLQAAGIDPSAMVDAFRALERETPDIPTVAAYVSTHPRTADRIERLTALASNDATEVRALLPDVDWRRVAAGCDSDEPAA